MMQENNTQDVETPVRLAKNVIENFSKLFQNTLEGGPCFFVKLQARKEQVILRTY